MSFDSGVVDLNACAAADAAGVDVWSRISRQLRLYYLALRPKESIMMLGVPLLGVLFSLDAFPLAKLVEVFWLFFGAALVAGHVYTLNDLMGLSYDIYDASKRERPLMAGSLRASEVFGFSMGLLLLGLAILLSLSLPVFVIAVLITLVWVAYAAPGIKLKAVPVVTSLVNAVGAGCLPFLLGYVLFAGNEQLGRGLLLSIYFGIIAGAGQMNREIVDLDVDVKTSFRTTAVWLGRRWTFVTSFALFMLSTAFLVALAVGLHTVPMVQALIALAGAPVHAHMFWVCLRSGVTREATVSYVRDYRLLYLVMGLAMVGDLLARLM
ncbi:MAG: UbiA prenyltransferase family protein [Candidatus Schekmanbacteria bacterium]|nr:UbiA prenyltransferase family protein [Candidatus Schekmanbacteria bacterium]